MIFGYLSFTKSYFALFIFHHRPPPVDTHTTSIAPVTFHLGETSPDCFCCFRSNPVYPPVEEYHDQHGGEEGPDGGIEYVPWVRGQDALWAAFTVVHKTTGLY